MRATHGCQRSGASWAASIAPASAKDVAPSLPVPDRGATAGGSGIAPTARQSGGNGPCAGHVRVGAFRGRTGALGGRASREKICSGSRCVAGTNNKYGLAALSPFSTTPARYHSQRVGRDAFRAFPRAIPRDWPPAAFPHPHSGSISAITGIATHPSGASTSHWPRGCCRPLVAPASGEAPTRKRQVLLFGRPSTTRAAKPRAPRGAPRLRRSCTAILATARALKGAASARFALLARPSLTHCHTLRPPCRCRWRSGCRNAWRVQLNGHRAAARSCHLPRRLRCGAVR